MNVETLEGDKWPQGMNALIILVTVNKVILKWIRGPVYREMTLLVILMLG